MDDKTKTRPQDARRIDVNEDYELRYWAERFGVTKEQIRSAVAAAGPVVKDVEQQLMAKK